MKRSSAAHAPYQPFYCEENIWLLAQDPRCGDGERLVVLITAMPGEVAMWRQKPAEEPGAPVLWDYHVVLFVRPREHGSAWQAWDFECDRGMPIEVNEWIAASFPHHDRVRRGYRPRFRVMRASEYIATLRSDRSHMRARDGSWTRPPPPWAPPGGGRGSNLAELIDPVHPFIGEHCDLPGLRRLLDRDVCGVRPESQ